MKLLLTISIFTIMSTSAFAACDSQHLTECKDSSSCERLSTTGGVQYQFITNGSKCMVKDPTVATDCLSVNDQTVAAKGATAVTGSDPTNSGNGSVK